MTSRATSADASEDRNVDMWASHLDDMVDIFEEIQATESSQLWTTECTADAM